jgi:hypothetical protein
MHLPFVKKTAGVIAICFLQTIAGAQQNNNITIEIQSLYGPHELVLDSNYLGGAGEVLKFETFKFYISNLRFAMNDSVTWEEKESYHLYDKSTAKSNFKLIVPATISFNTFTFDLGIDSLTNVSGALGGDLDPTKGMYWTWQSGYINFKLEGKSSGCQNPKKEFQYHLGGYQNPFDALQTISLPVTSRDKIKVAFDVKKLLGAVNFAQQDHIMSPGAEALKLSLVAVSCFSSVQP